jgi:hypothetical protein
MRKISARNNLANALVSLSLLTSINLASAQTHWHEGGRPGAMGGAFVAVSNDVNALAFNPAGLVHAPQTWLAEFSLQNPFASGLPFRESLRNEGALTASSFGVVYNRLRRPNQTQPVLVFGRENFSRPLQPQPAPASSNVYSLGLAGSIFSSGWLNEMSLRASFSKGFFEKEAANPLTNHLSPRLAWSATLKLLGLQYDARILQNAEVNSEDERRAIAEFFAQNGREAWGLGLDLGLMAELHSRVHAALSWNNVLAPDLALRESAPASRNVRAGVAVLVHEQRQALLAVDYERSASFPKQRFYLGMESGVLQINPNVLRARVGVNRNWLAAGFMLAEPGLVELHYAFLLPTLFSEDRPQGFFQHRFSVAFAK